MFLRSRIFNMCTHIQSFHSSHPFHITHTNSNPQKKLYIQFLPSFSKAICFLPSKHENPKKEQKRIGDGLIFSAQKKNFFFLKISSSGGGKRWIIDFFSHHSRFLFLFFLPIILPCIPKKPVFFKKKIFWKMKKKSQPPVRTPLWCGGYALGDS